MIDGIAEKLRTIVAESGQTLQQIERATGISADSISRFLEGKQSLRLESAEELLRHFRVTVTIKAPKSHFAARMSPAGRSPPMSRVINMIAEKAGIERQTQGHFLTVAELESAAVKVQLLRRKRGTATVIAVGIACDSNDAERNASNARRYERVLSAHRPSGEFEKFPEPKSNWYLTVVRPIPADPDDLADYVSHMASLVRWFLSLPYGKET